MEERHYKGRAIIEKAGEYAPAWGMIGTLIGLFLMLGSLDDPSTLGPNMAVALLTTLYGTVLANLVFIPIASRLENKMDTLLLPDVKYAAGGECNPRHSLLYET